MNREGVLSLALEEPTAPTLSGLAVWLRAVAGEAARDTGEGPGFLVITPLGLGDVPRLERRLEALGIRPAARIALPRWSRVATAIRVPDPAAGFGRLRTAALFEATWRSLFPLDRAEAWAIPDERDHLRLSRAKALLRGPMRHLDVDFGLPGQPRRLLTPLHVADADDRRGEARRLLAAVRLAAAGAVHRAA